MVSIKKITIYGFKSFGPRRNVVEIPRGFTVITGPNGGGKSNVIDAVKFALGELSPHALRVSRLSELIYESNGSRPSYARVSVVFDNSDRGIPIDADEVTVTRRLMQSGESVYQINGKSVSRMELLTILSAANIKPSGYNIISQGAVLGIAETSPEDLRKLIDEIAGTAEYDRRKAEALEQLDQAERNIAVARAGTSEVKQRVRQLELEKTQLIRRSILERELLSLRREKLMKNIAELDSEMGRIMGEEERILSLKAELESELSRLTMHRTMLLEQFSMLEASLADAENRGRELSAKIESSRAELERIKSSIRSEGTRVSTTRRHILELETRARNGLLRIEELRTILAQLSQRMNETSARLSIVEDEYQKLQKQRNELSERLRVLDDMIARHRREEEKVKQRILERERELEAKRGRLASLTEKLQEKKTRLSEITEEIKNLEDSLREYQESLSKRVEEKERIETRLEGASRELETLKLDLKRLEGLLAEVEKLIVEGKSRLSPESSSRKAVAGIISSNMGEEVVGLLSDLFRPPPGLEALYALALRDRLDSLVVRHSSVAAALAMAAAEKGVELSVISIEEPYECPGEGCLACMAETNSAEAVKALHIAMNSARLILDHEGFRRGEPAISVGGAYWDGNGYLASLGEVGSIQRTIETINDLIKMEDALKTEIKEREARSKNLEREIDSLRSEKIRTETDINLLLEKCKISEKTLSMLREEKEKLENLAKQIEIEIDRTNKETEDTRREVEVLSSSLPREEQVDASQRSILIDQLEALDRSLSSSAASRSELISEVKTIKQRIGELTSEIQSLEYSVKEFTERRNTLEEAGREYKNSLRRYAEKFREELDKQIKLLEEIKSHSGLLAGLKEQVASVRSQLDETNSRIESLRARLGELDNQHQGVRLSKMELTMRKNTLEEKLREISVQVEGDLTSLDPDVKEEVYSMLESEMSSMGPVNQLAAMQYVELVENYKSRSLRIAELEKERREILKVIEMIDSEKQELFLSTMKKISEGFGYFFNRLTGGEAWLELSDPEKPNESGVEMIVKFVGKSPRSSRSVSGGEKSVAAVALLMSFQGMTPADFLIFDEVDAHMDASYTRNLSELFSEMSSKTQIIAISLKDVMAERADLLVGVYNQSGESRIVVTKIGEKTSEGQGNSN